MTGEIDWDDAPLNTPLWCVYGPDCFPTVFACKITDHPQVGRCIWGFSTYRRAKGFRTLGVGREWALRNDARLFLTRPDAFAHIASLFPPADFIKATPAVSQAQDGNAAAEPRSLLKNPHTEKETG